MFNAVINDRNSLEDQQRDIERSLMKANRDNELERKRLLEQEEKIENEIRTNNELGNNDICRILAKQLVDIRKQKARTFAANSKINALIYQQRANSVHNMTINSTLGISPNISTNMYDYMPSSNVNNMCRGNPRLDIINDALDDMLIEADNDDEFIDNNYNNTPNNTNSNQAATVTNNSVKANRPHTTNITHSSKAGSTTNKTKTVANSSTSNSHASR